MVRDPETAKYRCTWSFVMTLGYSRKSGRLLGFRSNARIWAELHEEAFSRLDGAPSNSPALTECLLRLNKRMLNAFAHKLINQRLCSHFPSASKLRD